MGAPRVHIIDLDGAAAGRICNLDVINEIARALLVPTQVGGGVRSLEVIEELLVAGVERIILGTSAVEDPELVKQACLSFRESIVVGVDTRRGHIAIHGWQKETELRAIEFVRSMADLGVKRIIHTDINRDGTLTEPNFSAVSELINNAGVPVIAAGGITSLNHLKMLNKLGAEGAIIGKALYTKDIDLKEALAVLSQ
jgi:phosphoribosylformimino-5-aminoimidazole carboxamide ribotide isomerase